MDILERITELREERHWTEYQLAERSGMTQSTISSWYRKDISPSIPSIIKICEAFGITVSQFFAYTDENVVTLTEEQLKLIKFAAKLNPEQYDCLLKFLETL
ncbi:MAG: helix-turn-helix transcriptional regulator [Lachnospiraceae bacterium]|nr:helix-turn-helix transcriptional regulator [Lachnospiraceae bacterium]